MFRFNLRASFKYTNWKKQFTGTGGFKEILQISVPFVVVMLSITALNFTDRLFLAWYSPESIAAIGPAGSLSFSFLLLWIEMAKYCGTIIARYYGSKKYAQIGEMLWQGIYFSLMTFIPFIFCLFLGNWIFDLINHGPEIVKLEKIYFSIWMLCGVFIILQNALASFFLGLGKTRVIMVVAASMVFFNIILNYILIFGKFGSPEFGIAGAAIGSVLAVIFSCFAYFLLIARKKYRDTFFIFKDTSFKWPRIQQLLWFGLPHGFAAFADMMAFTGFCLIVGTLGKYQLAASNVMIGIYMVGVLPMIAMGTVLSVLISNYLGRGKIKVCKKIIFNALLLCWAYYFIVQTFFQYFSAPCIRLFQGSDVESFTQIFQFTTQLLPVFLLFLIGDMFLFIFGGVLSGGGDTHFKMWSLLSAGMVFIAIFYYLIHYQGVNLVQAWLALSCFYIFIGLVFYLRMKSGRWQKFKFQ